jgi:MFS family permease
MLVFVLWNVGLSISGNMVFPAFASMGFSIEQLLLMSTLCYSFPLFYLMFFRKYDSKITVPLGILSVAFGYFLLTTFGGLVGATAIYAFGGLCFFLFWVPFNSMWFGLRDKKNAGHSTLYNAIMMTTSLIMPVLSGYVAQFFGFGAVFASTIVVLIIAAVMAAKLVPQKKAEINFSKAIGHLSGFRSLVFLEGIHQVAPVFLVFIISLQYFPKPSDYGLFMSLATVLSIISSFLLAKISDRSGQRREFILMFSVGLAISTFLAAAAGDVMWWFVAVSLINFFRVIFFPFPLALLLDRKENIPELMYGREIFLNLGRSTGGIISLILYILTGNLAIPLVITGLSMFAYAILFEFAKLKKIHADDGLKT